MNPFNVPPQDQGERLGRSTGLLKNKFTFKDETYEYDFSFKQGDISFDGVHTMPELMALLEKDPSIKVEATVLALNPVTHQKGVKKLDRGGLLEAWKSNENKTFRFREDSFSDGSDTSLGSGVVGDDFVPLMGGPFNKQMYLYDRLRALALGFHAYHHDPFARAIVHITRDFTLGRGYRVDSKDNEAVAIWRAFEEVNNLQELINFAAIQLSIDGEVMVYKLPIGQKYLEYKTKNQSKASLPRVRLIDPSTCWEKVTYPEDMTRALYYQLVYPTQYQMYTGTDKGEVVPASKFIMMQVPAEQVDHYRVNCVSNEKHGRSDLYPVFGYLKRLRDTISYSVIAMQKAAAWAIDTSIEGNQTDIQNYIDSQQALGEVPPAGSEFVHTSKVKREYMSNQAVTHGSNGSAFEWCLNCVAAATQIPVNYFGTHISGGSTRASALVATEPVAKKFEMRQLMYERMIKDLWTHVMIWAGKPDAECEVTFPEIIVQDRSQKLKDLVIGEDSKYFSHERCANVAAKEMSFSDYDWDTEKAAIEKEQSEKMSMSAPLISPLLAPAAEPAAKDPETPDSSKSDTSNANRRALSMSYGS